MGSSISTLHWQTGRLLCGQTLMKTSCDFCLNDFDQSAEKRNLYHPFRPRPSLVTWSTNGGVTLKYLVYPAKGSALLLLLLQLLPTSLRPPQGKPLALKTFLTEMHLVQVESGGATSSCSICFPSWQHLLCLPKVQLCWPPATRSSTSATLSCATSRSCPGKATTFEALGVCTHLPSSSCPTKEICSCGDQCPPLASPCRHLILPAPPASTTPI